MYIFKIYKINAETSNSIFNFKVVTFWKDAIFDLFKADFSFCVEKPLITTFYPLLTNKYMFTKNFST